MNNEIALEITTRAPLADGHKFGQSGPYERLRGHAHFTVDPNAPAQSGIRDLEFAPRNACGNVEFSADFLILKPVDPARGNGRLFDDCGNRGNMRSLQYFNDAPAGNHPVTREDAGNGFLFRRGYTLLWSAWQSDVVPGNDRMVLDVPVATQQGTPITGTVLQEYAVRDRDTYAMPISGRVDAHSYPTVSLDTRNASLTRRRYPYSDREPVPPDEWEFARIETDDGPAPAPQGSAYAHRAATSSCDRGSNRAGSTNSSTPRRTRWCSVSVTSPCAISSVISGTNPKIPQGNQIRSVPSQRCSAGDVHRRAASYVTSTITGSMPIVMAVGFSTGSRRTSRALEWST